MNENAKEECPGNNELQNVLSKKKNPTPSQIFDNERILSSDYDSEPDLNRIFRKYMVFDTYNENKEKINENDFKSQKTSSKTNRTFFRFSFRYTSL